MNTYARALILSAMTAVSLTQGCSCSDDDDPNPVVIDPPVTPDPVVTTINGSAGKGIILGGVVNILPIIDGVLSDNSVASGVTGDDGSYSVGIDDYTGSPFVVRVTSASDGSTSMVCDLAGGCGGDVAFGGRVAIDDATFNLDAVVPPVTGLTSQVNLSVLTDTATDVALATLGNGGGTTLDDVITAVSNANSTVANRFGIQGDITTLPIVDLTNPTAVAAVNDNNVLNYNLFSAAIVEALINDNNSLSIAAAVTSFAAQFADVDRGLTDNAVSANVTSLAEILAQAGNVIDAIRETDTTGLTNLGDLETFIDSSQMLAELQPPTDTGSQGTPSETNNDEPLAKARALVAVLGDLSGNIEMTILSEGITIGAQSDAFEAQLEAAEIVSSDAAEQVLEATAKVVEAFAEAYDAYYDNHALTQWQSDNGVVVSVSEVMTIPAGDEAAEVDYVKLMVGMMVEGVATPASVPVEYDGMMVDVAVYMTAMENVDTSETMADGGMETHTAMGSVGISGTAENAGVKLTVKEGSMASLGVGRIVQTMEEVEGVMTDSAVVTAADLELNLMAMLEQKGVTDAVSFDGSLSAALETFSATEVVTLSSSGEEMGSATEEISMLSLALSGAVMNSSGDTANVVFTIEGNGTGLDLSQNWLGDFDSDSRQDSEPEENNFAAVNMSLALDADMAGVDDALKAVYVMTRTGDDKAAVSLNLWYDAIHLTLDTAIYDDAVNQSASLRNQDGVRIDVTDTDDGIEGTIFVGSTKVANINGPLVSYTIEETDESGETFFRSETLDIFDD